MKMIGNVCIFLTVALFVTAAVMIVITRWCINLCKQWNEEADRISQLEVDNALLLDDKRELIVSNEKLEAENRELYDDNIKLTAAIKELKAINNELMNNEAVHEVPTPTETHSMLPASEIPTNIYRCEGYKFAQNSQQAMLQDECFTDEIGIRCYISDTGKTWYCAALAGAYGMEIGHAYTFTLANGEQIPVIMSDFKHPINNVRADDYGDNDVNYLGEDCINIVEFIVDMDAIPKIVKQSGTMSALATFGGLYSHKGNIVEVKDEGRVWRP